MEGSSAQAAPRAAMSISEWVAAAFGRWSSATRLAPSSRALVPFDALVSELSVSVGPFVVSPRKLALITHVRVFFFMERSDVTP